MKVIPWEVEIIEFVKKFDVHVHRICARAHLIFDPVTTELCNAERDRRYLIIRKNKLLSYAITNASALALALFFLNKEQERTLIACVG